MMTVLDMSQVCPKREERAMEGGRERGGREGGREREGKEKGKKKKREEKMPPPNGPVTASQ